MRVPFNTTAPAETMAPSPMVTPGMTNRSCTDRDVVAKSNRFERKSAALDDSRKKHGIVTDDAVVTRNRQRRVE